MCVIYCLDKILIPASLNSPETSTSIEALSYVSSANLGEESMMSSKEIPHIELESAVSLPDWMKKAKEETVNSDEAFTDIHEQGDKNQDQLCVKMVSGEFHINLFSMHGELKHRSPIPESSWRAQNSLILQYRTLLFTAFKSRFFNSHLFHILQRTDGLQPSRKPESWTGEISPCIFLLEARMAYRRSLFSINLFI